MKKKILKIIIMMTFVVLLFCVNSTIIYAIDDTTHIATKTQSDVLINNEEKYVEDDISFFYNDAGYCIEGNNYYKLRNLAQFLNNTKCQFNVIWNEQLNSIEIYTNRKYDTVGNELNNSAVKAEAYKSNHKLYIDGREVKIEAYTIGGNNYFKLRDLSEYLGYAIDYTSVYDRVIIVTPESEYYQDIVVNVSETKIDNLMDNNISINATIDGKFLLIEGQIYNETTQDIKIKGELFLNNGSYAWYPDNLSFDTNTKKLYRKINLDDLDSYYVQFYVSYFVDDKLSDLGPTIAITKENGVYYFTESKSENTLKHINFISQLSNPLCYINKNINNSVVDLSKEIVGYETDKYKKLEKIYYWIAENIAYDYDYYEGRNSITYFGSEAIIVNKRTVCDGFSDILQDLLNAQDIPCIEVRGTANGESHTWNVAFVNNRWIFLDVTWDSVYGYRNGKFFRNSAEGYIFMNFDRDIFYFENAHEL